MHLPDLRKWLGRLRPAAGTAEAWPADEPYHDGPDQHGAEHDGAHAEAIAAAAPESAWTTQRIEIAEQLWGEGCVWPGGTDEVLRVAVPFGLSAVSSLLLLGAGSAGPTVRLAGELGVWVSAYESDPVLAMVAARRVQRAGVALAKRATVQRWTPAAPDFRKQGFHHALAIEALRGPHPERIVAAMCEAVKPGGHLAIVETVAPQPLDADDPGIVAWSRLERRAPPVPGTEWATAPLLAHGFDIRVGEDVTARHMRLAVTGWRRMVRDLRRERPPPHRAAALMEEAEFWLHRERLLRGGQLRVMRWLAIKGGG
jgi:hypothetical protein